MEKLNQMTYLEMVMQETLRMYPPFIRSAISQDMNEAERVSFENLF